MCSVLTRSQCIHEGVCASDVISGNQNYQHIIDNWSLFRFDNQSWFRLQMGGLILAMMQYWKKVQFSCKQTENSSSSLQLRQSWTSTLHRSVCIQSSQGVTELPDRASPIQKTSKNTNRKECNLIMLRADKHHRMVWEQKLFQYMCSSPR